MKTKVCECGKSFVPNSGTQIYCSSECLAKHKTTSRRKRVESDYKYRCSKILNTASFRANKLKVPFNIDVEYLIKLWDGQDGRCAISGRDFDTRITEKFRTPRANTPSLDRIIPGKGYTKDNVRFVCYQVNTALHSFGEEALISLCKDIMEYNEGVIH